MDVTSYLLGKKAGGGGDTPVLIDKNINANGTYNASNDNADGYKKAIVNVQPTLQTKSVTITQNGDSSVTKDSGYDGLQQVNITTNVPQTSVPDWTQIGYSGAPLFVTEGFNYAKQIYDNWDASQTSMFEKFRGDTNLTFMPIVDTSNVTDFRYAFASCKFLVQLPELNLASVTKGNYAFNGCSLLKTINITNTSNIDDFSSFFSGCSQLVNLPLIDMSSATKFGNMFNSCDELVNVGGFKDLGKAFSTTANTNYYIFSITAASDLSHDSLMNIINNLYDIATKGCNPQKLSIGYNNLQKLTQAEIDIATNKGWNVTQS